MLPVPRYQQETKLQLKYFFQHTTSTSVVSNWADTFYLSYVTNYAKYVALFDQFRIDLIEVAITPPCSIATSDNVEVGVLISAIDLNDNAAVAIAALEATNNSLETNLLQPHYHRFKPVFMEGNQPVSDWLATSAANTAWYGLKSDTSVCSHALLLNYFITLHVSFRGQN